MRKLLPAVYLAGILLAAGSARADGVFVAPEAVEDPKIPVQRAIVSHRDGAETLIVESTVEGPGEAFGWVLPVPAEPTAVTACGPGTLETVGTLVRPRVRDDPRPVLLVFLGLVTTLLALWRREGFVVAAALAAFLALPTHFGGPAGGESIAPGMTTVRAGNYDVSTIRPGAAYGVPGWAREQGFALGDRQEATIRELAAAGWWFVAARIARADSGPLTPHPLAVTFRVREAVYPMRLTGTSSGPVQLDLYVIGERRAEAEGLETWFSDRFEIVRPEPDPIFDRPQASGPVLRGESTGVRLGHPTVVQSMWAGCVVTHLRGEIAGDALDSDVRIAWTEPAPFRKEVLSRATAIALGCAVSAWTLALAAGMSWIGSPVRRPPVLRNGFLLSLVLGAAVVAGVHVRWTVVPTKQVAWTTHDRLKSYEAILAEPAPGGQEYGDFFRARVAAVRLEKRDPGFGVEGDVPWGYRLEGDRAATFYDGDGAPYRMHR